LKLIIVESPTKAKTIENYAGKDFKVLSSKGHIIDLPEKVLGINIEKDFEPDFRLIQNKTKIISQIKEESLKSEKIFIATDPDREGEAIAFHIVSIMDDQIKSKAKRVLFYEITKKGIKEGLENPKDINMNLVESQYARRILDRLVGYLISPFLWKVIKKGLSAGRVQSVALRFICEKEEKIRNFKSKVTFKIKGKFKHKNGSFFADLIKYNNDKAVFEEETKAKGIVDLLKQEKFIIKNVSFDDKSIKPYPPFITSTLQQAAANILGFPAKKTMSIAQQLYEGVKIENTMTGLITYMRTDSTRMSEDGIKMIRDYIEKNISKDYLSEKINIYESSKSSQDAHEAIRVTDVELTPEKVEKYLSKDQYKLYSLIWKRSVATQMKNGIYTYTTVDIEGGKFYFRGVGNRLKFDGFLKIYPYGDFRNLKNDIPEVARNDDVKLEESQIKKEETQPPSRYTDATLVKALEQKGIGRPSTYASIIDILLKREYVLREKRFFKPTELGETVNNLLIRWFPDIFDAGFTAKMEEKLDQIVEGKFLRKEVLKDFYSQLEKDLKNANGNSKEVSKSVQQKTDQLCEKCGSPMVIRWGRYGKFLSCTNYPKCSNAKPIVEEEEKLDEKCPICGKELVVKNGKYGKFISCSDYPKCKFTKNYSLGIKCPKDDGDIVQRKSSKGKVFYGCSNYPKCDFVLWSKPERIKCMKCGFEGMVRIKDKYKCIKCNHTQAIDENDSQDDRPEE
jgi:DNA topoisomerase-1